MMAAMLAAAVMMLTPPPLEGDERTEILVTVNTLIDALTTQDAEGVDALLETEGSMVAVDLRKPGEPRQKVTPFAELRKPNDTETPVMIERLGIPTLLQRGPIAQVWVPYRFSVRGTLSHCGIDAFTLVKRDDRWRIAGLVYTIEGIDQCKPLAAPESDN